MKKQTKFFKIVEIQSPPSFDELEAAGESMVFYENFGGDSGRGRREIFGDHKILVDLLEAYYFGDFRLRTPFHWHFAANFHDTPDRAGDLLRLAECNPAEFKRWFSKSAELETERLRALVGFLSAELKKFQGDHAPKMKSAAVGA